MGQPGTWSPHNHSKCQSPGAAWPVWRKLSDSAATGSSPQASCGSLTLLFLSVLQVGLLPAKKEQHSRVGWLCALPSSPSPAPSESSQQHLPIPKGLCKLQSARTAQSSHPQDSEGRVTGKGYKLEFSLHPFPGEWKLQRMLRLSEQSSLGPCCFWKCLQAGEGTDTSTPISILSSDGCFYWSSPSKAFGVLQTTVPKLTLTGGHDGAQTWSDESSEVNSFQCLGGRQEG